MFIQNSMSKCVVCAYARSKFSSMNLQVFLSSWYVVSQSFARWLKLVFGLYFKYIIFMT